MYRFLVTGATGLLGRAVVLRLLNEGHHVTGTSRGIHTDRLPSHPHLVVVHGELTDPGFVSEQVALAEIVIHCAAKTTNWGDLAEFESGNVVTVKNIVDACERSAVRRLLHVSSVAVYGHPAARSGQIDESHPIGQHLLTFDRYNRTKILAEEIVGRLGKRATIVRPTWFIGPGDRAFVPAFIRKLQKNAIWLIGSGANRLNGLSAEDVANGVILAATSNHSGGEIYNLCSDGDITQREFLDIICEYLHIPSVRRKIPFWVAWSYAATVEYSARLLLSKTKPPITRHDLTVFARPPRFSSQKAKDLLGWLPTKPLEPALRETLEFHTQESIPQHP